MPSLRTGFLLVLIALAFSSCSGEKTQEDKSNKEEELPTVDKSKFREFKGDGFSIQLLKEMSWNEVSGNNLLDADLLSKEYHLSVNSNPISRYKNEEDFPGDSNKQLKWFAKKEGVSLKDRLLNATSEKLIETSVDNRKCFKQTIQGKEYGFPLRKTFFLRYYKTNDAFIKITAWTPSKDADKFEKLVQYMGMTLKFD